MENPESTANTMKKSVSSFLDQMSNALNPLPDDEEEALMVVGSDTVTLSRLQVKYLFLFLCIQLFKHFKIIHFLVFYRHKSILWLMIQIHF